MPEFILDKRPWIQAGVDLFGSLILVLIFHSVFFL